MYRSCSKISPAREALRVRLAIATACPDSRALALRNLTRPYGANHKVTAGGTCLDSTRPDPTNAIRFCDERCFAVGPGPWRPDGPSRWTWSEAAQLPLGGLTRGTRANQRVDGFFTAATGSAPQPRLGTNAGTVALPQVAAGTAATIASEIPADARPLFGACRLPFQSPRSGLPRALCAATRIPPRQRWRPYGRYRDKLRLGSVRRRTTFSPAPHNIQQCRLPWDAAYGAAIFHGAGSWERWGRRYCIRRGLVVRLSDR